MRIDAPRVAGSINLRGGVVDDVVLKDYDETTQKDSEPVRLFSPSGTPAQQFAQFGWVWLEPQARPGRRRCGKPMAMC